MLQYVTVCCSVVAVWLQCVAVFLGFYDATRLQVLQCGCSVLCAFISTMPPAFRCCGMLQCGCSVLQCVEVCYSALQCGFSVVAVRCSAVAVCCSVFLFLRCHPPPVVAVWLQCVAMFYSVSQCVAHTVAVRCSVVAVCCSVFSFL